VRPLRFTSASGSGPISISSVVLARKPSQPQESFLRDYGFPGHDVLLSDLSEERKVEYILDI